MSELATLREDIRRLDAELLRLAAERLRVAARIGALKRGAGLALRDFDVERQVLAAAEASAATLVLPAGLARGLMQLLIGAAREEQERQSYSAYSGVAERILIVGGAGKMGGWLAEFFRNQGHRVSICDPAADASAPGVVPTLEAGLAEASFALVSTGLDSVPEAIERITAIGFAGVVFDVASLKGHLKAAIGKARERGLRITSVHPMFGPSARTLSDKVICLCDCGDADATQRVERFFSETAARIVRLSLDEHDHAAAYVLGLSHLANVVFLRVLADSGDPYAHFCEVASTTFASQMATSATVIRESPDLYYAIQRLNPFSPKVYAALRTAIDEISGHVLRGDRLAFAREMKAGRAWMDGHDAD